MYFRTRKPQRLTDKDVIVLADFANTTGDPVFDSTLKEAVAADLDQSPFFNVLSDRKVSEMLKLMGRSSGERITRDMGRELCLRTGSKALLVGSIAALGSHYALGMKAIECGGGDVLAATTAEASSREKVLQTLGKQLADLRGKLGESLASIQKFDKPLEEATTSSLEALQAYSEGQRLAREKGDTDALPFLKRAVDLDPNFARAYASLGVRYNNLGQASLAIENVRRAYELRDRVSEREKYYIACTYFTLVTGELEKAIQQYELWIQDYPRDYVALTNLGVNYFTLGQFERAAAITREALRLEPNSILGYNNLGVAYFSLSRLDEAKSTFEEALAHKLDGPYLRQSIYYLDFLRGDAAGMQQQVAWAMGKARGGGYSAVGAVGYRGLSRTSAKGTAALAAGGAVGQAERLQGDCGVLARERGVAGSGVRECSGSKETGGGGAGPGAGARCVGRDRAGAGAQRGCKWREQAGRPAQPGVSAGFVDSELLAADH